MQSCINFSTEIHAYQTEIFMYMSMTYCIKKLIHFLPSHLHGVFFCNCNSSCESSISTSIMDSVDPLAPNCLSLSCMRFGLFVGCKVQQWETSCPFLWQTMQLLRTFWESSLCLFCFLCAFFFNQHLEETWLNPPQNVQQEFISFEQEKWSFFAET